MSDSAQRLSLPRRVLAVIGQHGALVALLGLIVFMTIRDPSFLKPENVLNVLRQASPIGIVAIGMTFVITAGGIDLSVGSIVALAGGLGLMAANRLTESDVSAGSTRAAAMGAIVVLATLAGLLNGLIIRKFRLAPFIATLATMAIYRSVIYALADGGGITTRVEGFSALGTGGLKIPVGGDSSLSLHFPILIFIAVAGIAWFVLNKTTLGVGVRAMGDNETAARYAGVRTDGASIATYAIVGLCCGIASLLLTSRMMSVTSGDTGRNYELDAIVAVVIGGTSLRGGQGRIVGTVIGTILLAIVPNVLLRNGVDANWQGAVKGAIILSAVLLQRLLGPRERA